MDHVEIPPATEVVVPGYTRGIIDRKAAGFLETDTKFLHFVGKALVCPLTGTLPVRITNPYNHSCKLYKDTIVASYEPVDPEQIISVNRTETLETDVKLCSETEVPEHLKDVYSKRSECLTPEQQARLKELLIKYKNTVSKSKHDLGRSSLVEYEINVIPGTKPIKQQP